MNGCPVKFNDLHAGSCDFANTNYISFYDTTTGAYIGYWENADNAVFEPINIHVNFAFPSLGEDPISEDFEIE